MEKERQSYCSEETYKVVSISEEHGQNYYSVAEEEYRGYTRAELCNTILYRYVCM
jgi:hypothetical protein